MMWHLVLVKNMKEMIFHVTCNDKKGVIARFTNILYENGANILTLEQHVNPEDGYFFMRIHADLQSIEIDFNNLENKLNKLAD